MILADLSESCAIEAARKRIDDDKINQIIYLDKKDVNNNTALFLVTNGNQKQFEQFMNIKDKLHVLDQGDAAYAIVKGISDEELEKTMNFYIKCERAWDNMASFNDMLSFTKNNITNEQFEAYKKMAKFFGNNESFKHINSNTTKESIEKLIKVKIAQFFESEDFDFKQSEEKADELIREYEKEISTVIKLVEKYNISTQDAAYISKPENFIHKSVKIKRYIIKHANKILENPNIKQDKETESLVLKAIDTIKNSSNKIISPTNISKSQRSDLFKGFLANNNNIDETVKNANFKQFKKNGLPLKYSRSEFLKDLNKVLDKLADVEKNKILNKLQITLTPQKDGYDGIINDSNLLKGEIINKEAEEEILKLTNKFIRENSIATGDKNLDKVLNCLIQGMPEFINIIGKRQHQTHAYSLDIHILTVYQKALQNPEYKTLTNTEKTCLKLAALTHDLSKNEDKVDEIHPAISAMFAQDILNEYIIPTNIKNRICELIENHHWFSKFNTGKMNAETAAVIFRRTNDLKISKILARADLEGIGNKQYLKYIENLEDVTKFKDVENFKENILSSGIAFFPSRIINKNLIPEVEYENEKYRVINFSQISDNTDLGEFGFEKGTKKKDLRLLVHMTKDESSINDVKNLVLSSNKALLSTSFISLENKRTYANRKFGVSLQNENTNIINACSRNQSSGDKKDFNTMYRMFMRDDYRSDYSNYIKQELKLTDKEYAILYHTISSKKYLSQIKGNFKIGKKTIEAQDLTEAIKNAQNHFISKKNGASEICIFTPSIDAVVTKVDSLNQVPQAVLCFAKENNLPIYLLGKDKTS